ncbi:hypothetical protein LLH06_20375 [Mucilaginibacter daejeonensis]|uniref:hypothetical protein n=1 Tax=Mucilaginibacter daejeonensis TaxID=398049 RepID=UPI001D174788|nr:hypothetical protein [Mucilaginibacter daejeonensis]UEG53296.1 hypothetical protein LLH06_20375 [Mucilaginibacter daejeonensis]
MKDLNGIINNVMNDTVANTEWYLLALSAQELQGTLRAKKSFCLGDSFTQENTYPSQLADALGMTLTHDGIGWPCMTGGTNNAEGDGTNRSSAVDRIDTALASNPDVIILEFESNDGTTLCRWKISSTD